MDEQQTDNGQQTSKMSSAMLIKPKPIQRRITLNMAKVQMIDILFENLAYEIEYRGSKKQILKGLNGVFKSGELTAIMGPSGAGKSTLLNILTDFEQGKLSTGTIQYIDKGDKQKRNKNKKQSCYIQQVDCLHGLFTVQEIMMIATYLKIDKSVTEKFRLVLIDNILNTMILSKIKDTKVDRLSGGQRKRLSIALELIDNPSIMFLDEPTTGLDSLATLQCVNVLQTLAHAGRTVICTIHQPSALIYQMFDHIYLLVEGHCMYNGPPDDTISYFAQQGFQCPKYHNPADYIIEVVSQEYGNYNDQLIAAAKQYRQTDKPSLKSYALVQTMYIDESTRVQIKPPSELTRFWILLHRCAILLHRDWMTTHMRIVIHFLVAILLGLCFEQSGNDGSKSISNLGYLVASLIYLLYTSMMPAILRFPSELAILKKECFNNWYKLKTYYAATIIANMPLQICFALIYSTVSYLLTGQLLEWSRYLMYLLIAILMSFIAESMGMGLGTILNPINGTFVGSIWVCVMLCLTGFLAFFRHMPLFLYYISYLNFIRYAFDGLLYAIYGNGRAKLSCSKMYCHYQVPSTILEDLNMSKPMFWLDIAVLLIHIVIFRIITYVTLKRRLSKPC